MAGVNKVILIGNVGMIETKNSVTKVSLATSSSYKDKNSGQKVESTQWHRLVIFGKLAEVATKYVRKGSKLYIEGEIKYGKYTDQQGIERYTSDIVVRNMQMLDSKKDSSGPSATPADHQASHDDFQDDDVPF